MNGLEIAALITATVGLLGLIGSGLVWVMNRMVEMGQMMSRLEQIGSSTNHQVTNDHNTNLRQDITEIKEEVGSLRVAMDNSIDDRKELHKEITQLREAFDEHTESN